MVLPPINVLLLFLFLFLMFLLRSMGGEMELTEATAVVRQWPLSSMAVAVDGG